MSGAPSGENKDITNRELLKAIHQDIQAHSLRLSKIEDAIIQLAATQERVRVLDEALKDHVSQNSVFQSEVWSEFKEVHQVNVKCLEARAIANEKLATLGKSVDNLEGWQKDANVKIAANAKIRNIVERVAIGVAGALIVTIIVTIFSIGPSKNLEGQLSNHLKASTEIQELIKKEHTELEELKILLEEHKQETGTQ